MSENRITAAQARELVEKGGRLDPERLREIRVIIETKAYVGFTHTTMKDYLGSKPIIEVLKEDGYKCELIHDQREGDYWQIEW